MKLSSVILSSFLALSTTVNGKPVIDNSIAKDEMVKKIDIGPSIPIEPLRRCPIIFALKIVDMIQCSSKGGKYYQKYNEYPECNYDYVCFLPDDSEAEHFIEIDGKDYSSSDFTSIDVCKLSDSYDFVKCVKEAENLFTDLEYKLVYRPKFKAIDNLDIPPPPPPPGPINIPPNLPTFTFKLTPVTTDVEPSKTTSKPIKTIEPTLSKILPTDLIIDPILIKPTDPIVRPTTVPEIMEVPPQNDLIKRATTKTPVAMPTKTTTKPIMVKVDYPLRPIDFIKTGLIVKETVTKEKPYKPTSIPIPIVTPTTVPMGKGIPQQNDIIKRDTAKTPVVPTKTTTKPIMVKVDYPLRPIDFIKTGLIVKETVTKEKPYKPTSIPIPIVTPTTVPMGKGIPPQNDLIKKTTTKTPVAVPTKTTTKPIMVEVDYPLRPIDFIKTDFIVKETVTKEKPYKPTSIPVPIVTPTTVPMGKGVPSQKE